MRRAISQCHALWCACSHLGKAPELLDALGATLEHVQSDKRELILSVIEIKLKAGGVVLHESEAWRELLADLRLLHIAHSSDCPFNHSPDAQSRRMIAYLADLDREGGPGTASKEMGRRGWRGRSAPRKSSPWVADEADEACLS